MSTLADRILEALDDPDLVCESAYRAVHEAVTDALDSIGGDPSYQDDADIKRLILGELENIADWANTIREQIEEITTASHKHGEVVSVQPSKESN